MYKDNLRFAIEKYSKVEIDLLSELVKFPVNSTYPIVPQLTILFLRILQDGLVVLVEDTAPKIRLNGVVASSNYLVLTDKGREFEKNLKNKKIGYEYQFGEK